MFATFKNLKLIQWVLLKINLVLFCVGAIFFIIIGQFQWILSLLLGMIFSFIVFTQLLMSQEKVLKKRNKAIFFPLYFLRLLLYAVPLLLAFMLKNKLNLFIVIGSLFTFQITFIVFEFNKNWKRYRKRK